MEKTINILIADDYHQMRLAVQHVLSNMELHNLHQASQGLEARHILESVPISLIIADWNMPGMSGYELLCWCRNDPHYRNVPFILLTAESGRDSLAQAIAAGVSDYLVKPFTAATLRSRIVKLIGGQAEQKPLPPPSLPRVSDTPLLGIDAPSEERLSRASVLVVDDVATNIEVIAGILKSEYAIKVAISGRKALEIANGSTPPDLILLDVMMPEMDGNEVCRQLKSQPATRDIPVIFLTARDQVDDVVDGLALGAVDYVVKPAQPAILKARIRTHLRLSQARRDLLRQNAALADNARLREDIERITHHDLKNPISAISHTAELLLLESDWPDTQRERLQLLDGAARQALDLVTLSLTLYKIEQGQFRLESARINLGRLLETVVQEIKVQFAWKPVEIRLDIPVAQSALGENALCRSVFANLLKNAVEASPDETEVHVQLLRAGGECTITLRNHGVVPLLIREHFFDKYVSHGKSDGTGLGSYSAKLLTEAQGGRISLACDDDAAQTCLTVYLPAAD
ncbi:response regulator [Chitinimonas arctica]|nr:response regulator [Chitinimonas arctica]